MNQQTGLTDGTAFARMWYQSPACKTLLGATESGRLMFVWEARLSDNNIIRQFEDIPFERSFVDPDFALPSGLRRSTDVIPRDKVVQFTLFPTARTKLACAWFRMEGWVLSTLVDPTKEDLLAYWLIDHHLQGTFGRMEIARQVIGSLDRATGKRRLTILSPSGNQLQADNDNQSYEGE